MGDLAEDAERRFRESVERAYGSERGRDPVFAGNLEITAAALRRLLGERLAPHAAGPLDA